SHRCSLVAGPASPTARTPSITAVRTARPAAAGRPNRVTSCSSIGTATASPTTPRSSLATGTARRSPSAATAGRATLTASAATAASPAGQGNSDVLVVINTAKFVRFGGAAHPTKPGKPPPTESRLLMLKSPMMKGAGVRAVQHALNQRNNAGLATNGAYGPATRDAVINWQGREHIEVDGIVGPQPRSSLGLPK